MKLLNEEELFQFVNQLSVVFFHKPFLHDVQYNPRLRTTGGRYLPNRKKIELNPKYLIELGVQEFTGIIKHELCHYHLHIEGKGYKHGDKTFKALLRKTESPRYCKPLPSNKNQLNYLYTCKVCHFMYKRVRKVNINKYRCGKCGSELQLIKE